MRIAAILSLTLLALAGCNKPIYEALAPVHSLGSVVTLPRQSDMTSD